MKLLVVTAVSLSLLAAAIVQGTETIAITRSGSLPSRPGPAESFTGSVRIADGGLMRD